MRLILIQSRVKIDAWLTHFRSMSTTSIKMEPLVKFLNELLIFLLFFRFCLYAMHWSTKQEIIHIIGQIFFSKMLRSSLCTCWLFFLKNDADRPDLWKLRVKKELFTNITNHLVIMFLVGRSFLNIRDVYMAGQDRVALASYSYLS